MVWKDKDKIKEYQSEYYLLNKDKRKEYDRKYYLLNRDKINEYQRKHYLLNRDKIKEYQRKHSKRKCCKILYKTANDLKDDKDSLVRDSEFVKEYLGFTCEKIKEME